MLGSLLTTCHDLISSLLQVYRNVPAPFLKWWPGQLYRPYIPNPQNHSLKSTDIVPGAGFLSLLWCHHLFLWNGQNDVMKSRPIGFGLNLWQVLSGLCEFGSVPFLPSWCCLPSSEWTKHSMVLSTPVSETPVTCLLYSHSNVLLILWVV